MKNKLFFMFMFCCLLLQQLHAKDYYVAKNGKDTNNGSYNQPFKTFSKAVSVMKAGDVCIIRGGVYTEPLIVNKKGTKANYLTFKAADGENVKIKATKFINGWQLHSGNIYKTSVDMAIEERFRNVYHNQKHMDLARWPNNTDNNRFTVDCKFIDNGGSDFFSLSGVPNFDWKGGLVYYIGGHSGTSWTRRITKSTANRIEHAGVNINKWPFKPHNPTILRNGHRGQLYLFNKLQALDYAREWYYDKASKTLYFQPANGKKPANNTVEYATRKFIAELKGDFIKVQGIEFFGGSVKINGRATIFENNKVIHGSEGFDNIRSVSAGVGESSIEVLAPDVIIRGCVINHSSANGISVQNWAGAHNAIIEKNTISNIDYLGIHATPIRTRANNVKVFKNKITNSGRDGMYVSGDNCEVAYNDVSRAQLINADSGVFYTVGDDRRKGTEIHHNWFHDSKPPAYAGNKAAGIYLDNNSKGYVVHHNVVWNVSWTGYQVNWNNEHLDFFHNTIWNAGEAMDSWVNGYPQSDNRVYNNYSNNPGWHIAPGFEYKNNIINSTSPFEDANGLNFMPLANGSVVDAGIVIAGFDKKFNGNKPDIGAYELGGTRWTAGVNAVEDTGEGDATVDTIQLSNVPTVLSPSDTYTFEVVYSASTNREVVVSFWNNGTWIAAEVTQVPAGEAKKQSVTVTLPSIAVAGNGYMVKSHIRPIGTDHQSAIANDQVDGIAVVAIKDEIKLANVATTLSPADSYTFDVVYSASTNREVVVSFWNNGTWVAAQVEEVTSGENKNKSVTIALPSVTTSGNGYSVKAHIRPVGTDYQSALDNDEVTDINVFNQLISNGTYFIKSPFNSQRLLARGLENHSARMHDAGNFDDQKWIFTHLGDNVYSVQNKGTQRYLEVPNADCSNGVNVATWTKAIANHQKWKVVANGSGVYGLKPMHCQDLGLDRAQGAVNANAIIWNYNANNNNQKWSIVGDNVVSSREELTSTPITSKKEERKLFLFPNPSKDVLFVSGLVAGDQVSIYNIQGRKVKTLASTNEKEEISVANLTTGFYIVNVNGTSKMKFVKK